MNSGYLSETDENHEVTQNNPSCRYLDVVYAVVIFKSSSKCFGLFNVSSGAIKEKHPD
ncbi:MAG TPA: hypothetical protein VLD38_00915 [Nitrosopumilaceae archaeon]|nr:hypothetical protein [Nitrosopumilaceae archaeon]